MSDPAQRDKIVSVNWNSQAAITEGVGDYITGSITVKEALAAAFAVFVVSNVEFEITSTRADGLKVEFRYKGSLTITQLKEALKSGLDAYFLSKKPQGQAA
jgi:hypothetical protein